MDVRDAAAFDHTPVMLEQCLAALDLHEGDVFVDATLGGAGHSLHALEHLGGEGVAIGIDQDDVALAAAEARLRAAQSQLADPPEVMVLKGNFAEMDRLLVEAEVPEVDAFLFDLGVSSVQIDSPERGFSFKEDVALDMRMDPASNRPTAAEVVNTYPESELKRIIRDYSDEKWAGRIASFIVREREREPIETSGQLVEVVKAAIPASARRAGGHPAKRTFQALRIEVNGELDVLRQGLESAIHWTAVGGRIAVLSYHSLEDRIVKDLFRTYSTGCTCPPDLPTCACGKHPHLEVLTRKPTPPTPEEVARNPRARSAKLRVARKVAHR